MRGQCRLWPEQPPLAFQNRPRKSSSLRLDIITLRTMDEIIIEGSVKRESLVAAGVVNLRHFVFAAGGQDDAPKLCSYRNKGDASPSKTWNLSRNTSVSDVGFRPFSVRSAGQSTLGILAASVRGKAPERTNLVRTFFIFKANHTTKRGPPAAALRIKRLSLTYLITQFLYCK